ncbi:MAG: hypothetical protein M1830_008545 [Pleopsidium flavum]|nr:MAG: hypothetical protein M1830_008545 [Pleopsidium flavum]
MEAIEDQQPEDDYTLLHWMLTVKDKDGIPLERNYIASELFDHLNGAQETVAVLLTYVVYHLSKYPHWQARIREELQALPVQEDGFPSFADLQAAPLFDAFIREVHRVCPGASGRQERCIPDRGRKFSGIFVPEGIRASASRIALHRKFPSPNTFDPSRWLNLGTEQLQQMERSFAPFGYGARSCMGKAFATMEIKLLTSALHLQYSTRVDPDSATTADSMRQTGTMDSLPRGLRCDLILSPLSHGKAPSQV